MFIRTLYKVSQEWEKRFRAREGQSERKASPSSTNGLLAGCLVVFSFAGVPFPANSVTLPERFGADASYRSRPPPPLVEGAPKSDHCAASEPPGRAAAGREGDLPASPPRRSGPTSTLPIGKRGKSASGAGKHAPITSSDKNSSNRNRRQPAWLNLVENDKFKQRSNCGVHGARAGEFLVAGLFLRNPNLF